MTKTRLEVLEADHDSALAQLIENEINLRILEEKVIITVPGEEYNKLAESVKVRKGNVEHINKVISTIDKMMEEEANVN
jgi:hypothetical protein